MKQMTWNGSDQAYFGETSEGRTIRVEADEMAESAQEAGVDVGELSGASAFCPWDELSNDEKELLDPDSWASCIGANQNVEYI